MAVMKLVFSSSGWAATCSTLPYSRKALRSSRMAAGAGESAAMEATAPAKKIARPANEQGARIGSGVCEAYGRLGQMKIAPAKGRARYFWRDGQSGVFPYAKLAFRSYFYAQSIQYRRFGTRSSGFSG